MKTYFCKYALITNSRAGAYVYKCEDTVEVPEDVENVKSYVAKKLKEMQTTFKRCTVRITSFKEV